MKLLQKKRSPARPPAVILTADDARVRVIEQSNGMKVVHHLILFSRGRRKLRQAGWTDEQLDSNLVTCRMLTDRETKELVVEMRLEWLN